MSRANLSPVESNYTTRRTFLKQVTAGVALTLAGGLLDACTTSSLATPTPNGATPSPARGKLSVYSALNETTNREFVQAFQNANPGITVDLLDLAAAGDLQHQIESEKSSPKADILVGGSSEYHQALAASGLLLSYKSPEADELEFKDQYAFWTGWYLGIFGLAINQQRFEREMPGRKPPSSWDDLLDPAWQGNLAVPDPAKTGGGFILLATQVFRFNRDEDRAMEFMRRLNQNVAEYVGTSPDALEMIGQGRYLASPNWAHDTITAKNAGRPLMLVVPQPTGFEIGAVSIVKGGPNPGAARAFVDWVLTKEAAELNSKLSNRLSVRPDVPPAPGSPTLQSVQLVSYDREWAAANKDRLVKRWQTAISS